MNERDFRKKIELDSERIAEFESKPAFREAVVLQLYQLLKTSPDAETAPESAVRGRLAKLQALTNFLTESRESVLKEQQQKTLEGAERKIR